jgi:hypothetical protein
MKMEDLSSVREKVTKRANAAIAKIADQHAFDFKLDGHRCRYEHKNGEATIIGVPEEFHAEINRLSHQIFRFEQRIKSLNLKSLDVKRYLYKYFRIKAEINRSLRHVSVSVPLAD